MKVTLIRLTPWLALLFAGSLVFGLAGALVGALLLATAEGLQFLREARAMDAAHSMALARRTSEAEALAARLTEIERQLKEALMPERMQLAKDMIARKLGRGG